MSTISAVAELYKKVNVDPNLLALDHQSWFIDLWILTEKIQESVWDDGVHGVGQQRLQYMRVNKIINVNKVITR